jgi:hypothetical protein
MFRKAVLQYPRERLLGIEGKATKLRVRVNHSGTQGASGKRVVSTAGAEFIERLLRHVLPSGFGRIRHYGLLALASKAQHMAQARSLLEMREPQRQATEDAQDFMRRVAALEINTCPHCQHGRLRLTQSLAPQRGAPMDANRGAHCRGPL